MTSLLILLWTLLLHVLLWSRCCAAKVLLFDMPSVICRCTLAAVRGIILFLHTCAARKIYQQLCAYEDRGAADFKCGTLRSHKLVLLPLMQCSTGSNESMGSLNMCI